MSAQKFGSERFNFFSVPSSFQIPFFFSNKQEAPGGDNRGPAFSASEIFGILETTKRPLRTLRLLGVGLERANPYDPRIPRDFSFSELGSPASLSIAVRRRPPGTIALGLVRRGAWVRINSGYLSLPTLPIRASPLKPTLRSYSRWCYLDKWRMVTCPALSIGVYVIGDLVLRRSEGSMHDSKRVRFVCAR